MMKNIKTIILAAGGGTRMKSNTPKVIHKLLEKPLLEYVIEASNEAGSKELCVVIGHQYEVVKQNISYDVTYAYQKHQLGTGHAVMQAQDFIEDDAVILILFGDTPLITGKTLEKMITQHIEHQNAVTVLSTIVKDPSGYGRIIRNEDGKLIKSVEHKDATQEERAVKEINSGMYCFEGAALKEALKALTNNNTQGEYYLPDTLQFILAKGLKVDAMITPYSDEILGVNDRNQLYLASSIMKNRLNQYHMANGVTIINPEHTYIGKHVTIGKDTIIYPNSFINGRTSIGEACTIGANTKIVSCQISDKVCIEQSTLLQSTVECETTIGPYAYIRPNSHIGSRIKIGDFVEVKNSTIGDETKVSHLTYIGDADIGKRVNFGCGTVVVNYDGNNKHRTVVEDDAFLGCNTNLVSPVYIGENAYTAAGSTITKDLPQDALGIARARQINKLNWVNKSNK